MMSLRGSSKLVFALLRRNPLRGAAALVAAWVCRRFVFFCVYRLVVVAAVWLYFTYERLLGRLACWGIGRTPAKYEWTIQWISIRPSFSSTKPDEIVLGGWIWANPSGFNQSNALLSVDRLTIQLRLSSIWSALKNRQACGVKIYSIHLDGVHFHAERNREDALNLWVALALPDQDVNIVVRSLKDIRKEAMKHEQRTSIRRSTVARADPTPQQNRTSLYLLPATATRAAKASFQGGSIVDTTERRSCLGWLFRPAAKVGSRSPFATSPRAGEDALAAAGSSSTPRPPLVRCDTELGSSKRRPRWGVPLKLDVDRVLASNVKLNILDMLVLRKHGTAQDANDAIHLACTALSRAELLRGESKREEGIFLGELVWSLINMLVTKIVLTKPLRIMKDLLIGGMYQINDIVHYTVASTLETAINAPTFAPKLLGLASARYQRSVCVQLMQGRRMFAHLEGASKRRGVTTYVVLQLCTEDGAVVATSKSTISVWTRSPRWKERFFLGPMTDPRDMFVKLICVHNELVPGAKGWGRTAMGEIDIHLASLEPRDSHNDAGKRGKPKDVVGWFKLSPPGHAACGLLQNAHPELPPRDKLPTPQLLARPSPAWLNIFQRPADFAELTGEIKIGLKIIEPDREDWA